MTVEKDQFRVFFIIVPEKLAICGKRGRFRATSTVVKVVGNAILKIFCFITILAEMSYLSGLYQVPIEKLGGEPPLKSVR